MYRVLVVEDDAALQFIYRGMKTWSDCGFVIAGEASNGRAALDLLEKEQFDLIFTDIRMPFVDGIELLKTLKESGNTTPVIFASSYTEFEYAKQGITYGVFDYLIKPVDSKKLAEVLGRVKEVIDGQHDSKISSVTEHVLEYLHLSYLDDEFIRQIAEYVSEHYTEGITAEELADFMGFRRDYFGKLFKQHFGVTYNDFRSKFKMAYVITLLATGNYKAYEVSDMLGYPSYKYFSKVFKNVTGVVPTDYKNGTFGEKHDEE